MAELRNYNQDIEIDEGDLEGEWITHPSIYLYYNNLYSKALYERDEAKAKMEWVEAKIDMDVRAKWDTKYGLEKLTEAAVRNVIKTNKKYMAAQRVYRKTVRTVNSLMGVKAAFEHKKAALSNLVSLQITGFHSEPRNKIRDLKKAMSISDHAKHKEDLTERMKNRKKRSKNKSE